MKVFNKIKDHFNKNDFTIAPNKKIKTVKKEFKDNFGLSLRIYKGKQFAEDSLTIKQLNQKVSAEIQTNTNEELIIRASNKVGAVEELFLKHFGLTVQIADSEDKKLCDNELSLGEANRNN